ncbi:MULTISPECIES: hypothetical protein [unclassified Phyllobacterium]|uniref:hypothetical protein n=1 Tax=Phyllobacterium TaxID=28100 RepID=UPI000DD9B464|nr:MULTISPECIES: hypothetical protein [unclassified Phyllobacterium]MBA8902290.1 hypothetical protein [Phyllobacterium sp. P30BS-XVII]UGX87027.1 hypothetical protein LLE53_004025 [Phyllobacterium sp. T1293]
MPSNWASPQPIDTDPETAKLIRGAESVIQKKISPLAALCDELRERLAAYRDAVNAGERYERWRVAAALHGEIMEVWKSAFLNARAAVDDYLSNYDLNGLFSGREILVASLHGRCKPSVGIALSVMQFESERNLRRLAEISPEQAASNQNIVRKIPRVASSSRYR